MSTTSWKQPLRKLSLQVDWKLLGLALTLGVWAAGIYWWKVKRK